MEKLFEGSSLGHFLSSKQLFLCNKPWKFMCFKTLNFYNIFFCYSFMRHFHTNTTLPHEIEFIQKKNFSLFYEQEKILLMQKKDVENFVPPSL